MPRIKRGLNRRSYGQTKDPRTFFFIASEGTETEVAYFNMLVEQTFFCHSFKLPFFLRQNIN
jgi:hypothetical protein